MISHRQTTNTDNILNITLKTILLGLFQVYTVRERGVVLKTIFIDPEKGLPKQSPQPLEPTITAQREGAAKLNGTSFYISMSDGTTLKTRWQPRLLTCIDRPYVITP